MKADFFLIVGLISFTLIHSQTIYTVAGNGVAHYSGDGGPATAAEINYPYVVATDGAGNLYIADYANNRVPKVVTTGTISTIAGNDVFSFGGDGGPATAAELSWPGSGALDGAGNISIADTYNSRIRKITTGGIISTIAGSVSQGFGGDGCR